MTAWRFISSSHASALGQSIAWHPGPWPQEGRHSHARRSALLALDQRERSGGIDLSLAGSNRNKGDPRKEPSSTASRPTEDSVTPASDWPVMAPSITSSSPWGGAQRPSLRKAQSTSGGTPSGGAAEVTPPPHPRISLGVLPALQQQNTCPGKNAGTCENEDASWGSHLLATRSFRVGRFFPDGLVLYGSPSGAASH